MLDAQRLDQKYFGPINSTFTTVINGLVTFRAYRKFDFYKIQFMDANEKSANSTFCYNLANRWVGIRLDSICLIFGVSTALICMGLKESFVEPEQRALLTFSLSIVSDIIAVFSISIRLYGELENMMTSSQRIVEYTKLESEDALEKPLDKEVMKNQWPKDGMIEFDHITMRYRKHMDPSVIDMTCKI